MPHPHLTELYKIYQSETQPFRKVHRMIDLFESLIKMHTVVIITEYVGHNKLSDAAKGMLAQGLRTPSLGTWQLFSRILFEELQQDGYKWTFNGFAADFIQLDKSLNASKTNVIAFRNGYAHGATPTDAQCSSDISQYEPFLLQLLQSPWLQSTHTEQRDQQVWISSDAGQLCLHPILLFKEEGGASPYAFFNDLKNDKVGLLNYPLSKHYREKDFYKEFHQYLPLHEWKKTGNNEFYQRIEELTETFKGRSAERERLLQFVTSRNKGYLSIQGNPGIGKSALIARFFKDLKANEQTKSIQVVEYFIRRGTAQAQVDHLFNYLIRRTDELFPEGREIRAEGRATWELQQQLFSKWRLWSEKSNGNKLLMLIDGLDEGTENNVVTYLPRENFEGILIIYGSRPGGHKSIDELWTQLPVEHHDKLELTGLGKSDIRALIYEVSNKYELDRESEWIDAVQQRSQGNPLYLKLLCDAIEQGSITLNDIHALPKKIDEYYKAILDRYAADVTDSDALLNALFTFAAAKDYLTMAHIGLINRLGEGALQRIGSTLKEVLYENPLTEAVLDYQLFHESFREYLIEKKAKQVNDATERIIDFCNGWKELEGSWEQRYALEYLSIHLSESKREARAEGLIRLIYDKEYVQTQQKVLKQFEASNNMYRHALKKAGALKREEDMLEAALSLVDLKYAEANDAPQVVAMVASGDIDHALKRIESFGGNDEEGMKRKFTLYMLCLMELTLLDSKDKPFRKSAIEKILNHLDENIPVDHSLLKWNDFFPSYLMFMMACEWAELGLDYLRVYKRTDEWESNWILENGPYSGLQFEVLLEGGQSISDKMAKGQAINAVSAELLKQRKFEEAIQCVRSITGEYKSKALTAISREQSKEGKLDESIIALQESLECARGIRNDVYKCRALLAISTELSRQGKIDEGSTVLKEALEYALGNYNDWSKTLILFAISSEFSIQGKLDEALEYAYRISRNWKKSEALLAISKKLSKQGKFNESKVMMQESFECAISIIDEWEKSNAINAISTELSKQGKFEEAIKCIRSISGEYKCEPLASISTELLKKGKLDASATVIQESIESTYGIKEDWRKDNALKAIYTELTIQSKYNKIAILMQASLNCACGIFKDMRKSKDLFAISQKLSINEKLQERVIVVQESLEFARIVIDDWAKGQAIEAISTELLKQGKIDEALEFTRCISGEYKIQSLINISNELLGQGKFGECTIVMRELVECARGISDNWEKVAALAAISTEFSKQGKLDEYKIVMQESLECSLDIVDDWYKGEALKAISRELSKQGKLDEALEYSSRISNEWRRSAALLAISTELSKQGKLDKSKIVMKESLECALGIDDDWDKGKALEAISSKLSEQGKFEEALEFARGINDEITRGDALKHISTQLLKYASFALSEKTGLEITKIATRQECWKEIANEQVGQYGITIALNTHTNFQSEEAQVFYLKGWAESITVKDISPELAYDAMLALVNDSTSLEYFLQVYAQHELFFGNPSKEKIDRLNKSLNIQWALDIIARFPKEQKEQRLSTNHSEWIDQIPDEDDREEIELLARKVAKGKMTEEEFSERLKEF